MERKKAIEVVKNNWPDSSFTMLREALETLVPELKESEDERIRKDIVAAVETYGDFTQGRKEEIYSWLEKQDPKKLEEQFDKMIEADLSWLEKPADDKIEPKFNIGDIIFNKTTKEQFTITDRSLALEYYHDEDHLHEVRFSEQDDWEIIKPKFHEGERVFVEEVNGYKQGPFQIKSITQYGYTFDKRRAVMPFECESLMTIWSIADAKDGDVLYSPCLKLLWIFKSRDTVYCGCNLNYNDGAFRGEGHFERPTDAIPATMEQRDLLFQKMKEAGYEWSDKDKKLKELNDIQRKPAV